MVVSGLQSMTRDEVTVMEPGMIDQMQDGGRGGSDRARSRLAAAAAMMLILAGCASTVRSRINLPEPMPATISWSGPAPSEVTTTTADGLARAISRRGSDCFFHGQSGNRYRAARMAAPLAAGGGLLVASYRGYGDNPGEPNEAGIYADARAFLSLARELAPDSRIYLVGFSLGAAPALHTAAEEEVAGVVIIGAFAALKDVAPPMARGILPDRFDNRAAIVRVAEPILILHAPADEVVPFAQAQALRDLARERVRLLRLERFGHGVDFDILSTVVWENIRLMPR
jgi:fermentation-respiration switch protein FrsA (DUF1100 family)